MSPSLATFVYSIGIAGLFYLNRDSSARTSKALWIPVIWLWIVGSRGVSVWLGITPSDVSDVQSDSPVDRYVYLALLVAGIIVLVQRSAKTKALLKANGPILTYFAFCLVSVVWSDYPDVAFKRWIKAIGDVVMVLIIITDVDVKVALKRVVSRVGFILLPASVLLIKYYPAMGRGFSPWDGTPWNTGVTTNKNLLGVTVFVLTLGSLWNVLTLIRDKAQVHRGRQLLAQGTLLAFGVWLLQLANSATSLSCCALGSVLMIATSLPAISRRPRAVHGLILLMMAGAALTMFLGGGAGVAQALGRRSDLTGRTEIWDALIPIAPNAVIGAGFESFWLGPRLEQVRRAFMGNPLNEAHNGYLEIYLNLGWIGLCLIAWILISGYRRAAVAFSRDPAFGSLLLAYVAAGTVYNVTEAGFRMLGPNWIFLLFAIVSASGIVAAKEAVALASYSVPSAGVVRSFANSAAPALRGRKV